MPLLTRSGNASDADNLVDDLIRLDWAEGAFGPNHPAARGGGVAVVGVAAGQLAVLLSVVDEPTHCADRQVERFGDLLVLEPNIQESVPLS